MICSGTQSESNAQDSQPSDRCRWLLSTTLQVTVVSVALKLFSLAKEAVVARSFGAGDAMDAFLVALALSNYVSTLVGYSIVQSFLPTYVQVLERRGGTAARTYLCGIFSAAALSGIGILLAVVLVCLTLTGPRNFLDGPQALVPVMFVTFAVSTLTGLLTSALHYDNRFMLATVATAAGPVSAIVATWLGQQRLGVMALALGFVGGYVVEFLIVFFAAGRCRLMWMNELSPNFAGLLSIFRSAGPLVFSSAIFCSCTFIDQAFAASLGPGSVSALGYGSKVVSMVSALVAASFTTTVFPFVSRLASKQAWSQMRHSVRTVTLMVFLVTIPLTGLLMVTSRSIIQALFEGGQFQPATTSVVHAVQLGYLLQVPFYALAIVCMRALTALGSNSIVFKLALASAATNIAGDLALMPLFGVAGIATATSLTQAVYAALLLAALHRRLKAYEQATLTGSESRAVAVQAA